MKFDQAAIVILIAYTPLAHFANEISWKEFGVVLFLGTILIGKKWYWDFPDWRQGAELTLFGFSLILFFWWTGLFYFTDMDLFKLVLLGYLAQQLVLEFKLLHFNDRFTSAVSQHLILYVTVELHLFLLSQ